MLLAAKPRAASFRERSCVDLEKANPHCRIVQLESWLGTAIVTPHFLLVMLLSSRLV